MIFIGRDNDLIIKYIREYRSTKDIDVRNELIEICYYSLKNLSRHFYLKLGCISFLEQDDYLSIIVETFIYMIDVFDENKGCKFVTLFYSKAYFNIIDNIRKVNRRYRRYKQNILSLDKEYIGKNKNYRIQDSLVDKSIDIENSYLVKEELEDMKSLYIRVYNKIDKEKYKRVFFEYYFKGLKPFEINKILGKSNSYANVILRKINKEYLSKEIINYRKNLTK